jgi:uncharacterized iron-regulated membrane protein
MRRAFFTVHRWVGLVAGVVVVVLGLSGTALVYRAEIERFEARAWLEVEPTGQRLKLDELVAAAGAAWPAKRLTRVVFPESENESVQVVLQTAGARDLKSAELVGVFVNPYDGHVLGSVERTRSWVWWMQDLHYAFFLGEPGLKVNGVFAVALLSLALTGPVLWWPGRKRLKSGFRVRSQPAAARWHDLHAVSGVIASLLLVLIALTAMYYAFRAPATALITWATGDAPLRPPPVVESADPPATLEALHAAARAALPEATLDELRPARPGSAASVTFRLPGDHVVGRHRAWFDPFTTAMLRIDRHDELAAGQRLLGNMGPWHFGSFGGRLTRLLWFVVGLLPALLFGTGLWLWARRRRRA